MSRRCIANAISFGLGAWFLFALVAWALIALASWVL